jgi:serine-type D-Ala-D-Ala carboxypeptidase/endopeptidase (penicillin-binding protein 4)
MGKVEKSLNKNIKISLAMFLCFILAFVPHIDVGNPAESATQTGTELGQKVNELLRNSKLDGAIAGVSIRDAATGEVIFERNADTRLRPASNMKLLTTAAALETLGQNYTFSTDVLSDGNIRGKTLKGNLYLKGKGDPTLLKKDFDELAAGLKKKGISSVSGNVIGDDSWYDNERYSADLSWPDEGEYYGAGVSALTVSPNEDYDAGTVIVEVNPADSPEKNAKVTLTPETDYVKIVNRVRTVQDGEKKDIKIRREHGTNTIIVEGTIPLKAIASKSWVAVWEPTGYALNIFKKSLQEQHIKLHGKVTEGKTPEKAKVLLTDKSMPLSQLLIPFMKLSNNGHAEALVKEMGKIVKSEGSWEKGLEVVKTNMKSMGINTDTLVLRDGSGISHVDLIPANQVSALLFAIQKKSWFPVYLKSLPVAGNSDRMVGGTLRNRMKNTAAAGNVQAKTGTISTVSTLSGYVTGKNGEKYIFSILLNNMTAESVTDIQDSIAVLLANQ